MLNGNWNQGLAITLLAASLGACATTSSTEDNEGNDDINGLTAEQIAELRAPASPEVRSEQDREFAARMRVQADRAQAYLDQHVIPDFDRALRATANIDYATLQAEVASALQLTDLDARNARLDRFFAERGEIIDAAFASMGTTAARVTEDIRSAATAGDVAEPPAQMPKTRGKCVPGIELNKMAPYADAGMFVNGTNMASGANTASVSGAIMAQASVAAGWGNGGGFVRSDNLPPVGFGWTAVTTSVSFSTLSVQLLLWAPAYSAAGVGITIDVFDGGIFGPRIGSCRLPVLDRSIPIGSLMVNLPQTVVFQCAVHHAPTPFISTKVSIDANATHTAPWAGFAQSSAAANVTSILHNTCLD